MMRDIQLLDCTLRDGGFINNWEFGFSTIREIIYRLEKAKINLIELGFLNENATINENSTLFKDFQQVESVIRNLEIKNSKLLLMVDYGTFSIDNIPLQINTSIIGIRVIFKKKDLDAALEFCRKIKEKGYLVFIQPVSITTYSDKELLELIEKVNLIDPYSLSIVDTYGLLFQKDLIRYFYLLDGNLNKDIAIGYHSHNNFQLAYANSIELLEHFTSRKLMVDSSLYGMGKGAGNANTELIALYLNHNFNANYDLNQILELIETHIININGESRWGYSLHYFLSASNDCHPSYVSFLLAKNTLSIKSVNEILSSIPSEMKLIYSESVAIDLYVSYQQNLINDYQNKEPFGNDLRNREILVLAPGSTVERHVKDIQKFIQINNPIIITTNFIPNEFDIDYIFVSNSKRYGQLISAFNNNFKSKIVATSNVTESIIPIAYYVNYIDLLDNEAKVNDNSVLMLINLLEKLEVSSLHLAGFDGYELKNNYVSTIKSYSANKEDYKEINSLISEVLKNKKIKISFVTPSIYNM